MAEQLTLNQPGLSAALIECSPGHFLFSYRLLEWVPMSFKVTFEGRSGVYDALLSREQAIDWLTERRWEGLTNPVTGKVTKLGDLDDDRLAQALSRATWDLVEEIERKGGNLIVRNKPDDESEAITTVRIESIDAVKVLPVPDELQNEAVAWSDEATDELPLPFREDDLEWIYGRLEGFGQNEPED